MSKELSDIDMARALLALSCLWSMLDAAKRQTDIITWRRVGGLELEDFADAIDHGRQHPLLQLWGARKSGTNRPTAGLREQHARRLVVLLCNALARVGVSKGKGRKQAAKALALARTGLFTKPVTPAALKHWEQRMQPPLTGADERVITAAIASCGRNPQKIVDYFIGLVLFARHPGPSV